MVMIVDAEFRTSPGCVPVPGVYDAFACERGVR
jgi:hypothetical protein